MKPILGNSKPVLEMLKLIERVGNTKTNVLVLGESGTGKELVARMIHDFGVLKGKPFVPVNCGAIPENLIESELFGHKKGSFTGAVADRQGLFAAANSGTIFLDEVGELPLGMQVKLLRVIQERTFRPVGGNEVLKADVRIIAATNRNLERDVQQGLFREDLYYRLAVITISTPPLRERGEDILILAEHFLEKFAKKLGKPIRGFAPEVKEILMSYPWPGNVRELENLMERAVAFSSGNNLNAEAIPQLYEKWKAAQANAGVETATSGANSIPAATGGGLPSGPREIRVPLPDFSKGPVNLEEVLGKVEKAYLLEALKHTSGVKKAAAELLGITFRSIRYRLKKLGVPD